MLLGRVTGGIEKGDRYSSFVATGSMVIMSEPNEGSRLNDSKWYHPSCVSIDSGRYIPTVAVK